MQVKEVLVLIDAEKDLDVGKKFYDQSGFGIGENFVTGTRGIPDIPLRLVVPTLGEKGGGKKQENLMFCKYLRSMS